MANKIKNLSRRNFIQQASCAAIGGTTVLSSLLNMRAMGASSIFNSSNSMDYKAIVCLMFSGGNDSFNMLVPKDNNIYNTYDIVRSNLSIPYGDLLDLTRVDGGIDYGVHPSMPRMQQLFNNEKIAFIQNVGSLIVPITKQEFYNGNVATPLGLYSHSDQIMHWQTGIPSQRSAIGWGGKMAELLNASNTNANLSMLMSMSGSNLWQTGQNVVEYAISPTATSDNLGITNDNDDWIINSAQKSATTSMLDTNYQNVLMSGYQNITKSGRLGAEQLKTVLDNAPTWNTPFSQTNNGPQVSESFQMIANIINSRVQLGMNRQVFFVDVWGWDNHDELLNSHAELLTRVDNALFEFDQAMTQLGLNDQVTTFNVTEFGRTLSSNGDGSDHGWGGNVFAMGGAVNGGRIFGTYPDINYGSNDEIGGGVFIPTLSADEYFAELALWFGVPPSDLALLFPNIGNFYSPSTTMPIGFMSV